MQSQPSSSEPSSDKTVPLVIYGPGERRTEIGTAVVTQRADGWHAQATVTNERALALSFDKGPFSIARTADEEAIEAAVIPPWFVQGEERNAKGQA